MTMLSKLSFYSHFLYIFLAAGISVLAYIWAGCSLSQCGYPLDDAWIHQTYARNLSQYGEWSFIRGKPSAGSTSPLWTGLIAVGYKLGLDGMVWTYFLGWLCLVLLVVVFYKGFLILQPNQPKQALMGSIVVIFEWRFVWAAASGMETLLASLINLIVTILLLAPYRPMIWVGILTGIGVWVRPDEITLLFPILFVILFDLPTWGERRKAVIKVGSAAGLLALLYLSFNYGTGRMWLPATFFAKQAEYVSQQSLPILLRLSQQLKNLLVGVGAVLLPGFLLMMIEVWRKRNWAALGLTLWMGAYIFLYAWRLPVTYQHGRYLIPIMPVYFLLGFVGMCKFVSLRASLSYRRVVAKSWILSGFLIWIIFWGLGLNAYRKDVAYIQGEMVDVARWVAHYTETDALVASHDIGAMGYFGERDIIDLAGLITPQVIPFLRDQTLIRAYLDEKNANYLVTFPGWYPQLTSHLTAVYTANSPTSPYKNSEHMTVYTWRLVSR